MIAKFDKPKLLSMLKFNSQYFKNELRMSTSLNFNKKLESIKEKDEHGGGGGSLKDGEYSNSEAPSEMSSSNSNSCTVSDDYSVDSSNSSNKAIPKTIKFKRISTNTSDYSKPSKLGVDIVKTGSVAKEKVNDPFQFLDTGRPKSGTFHRKSLKKVPNFEEST
jgi:hypothetical protein